MLAYLKQFTKRAARFLIRLLTRYPAIKSLLVGLSRKLGLFDLLYRLNFSLSRQASVATADNQGARDALSKRLLLTSSRAKKRLAFISPLLPMRTGISQYCATLLPFLAIYYDIDVIVDQERVSDPWVNSHCSIRSAQWLVAHSADYDRVIYHFGNSPFHEYMFDLLESVPGVVVLHDFFLGHLCAKRYTHSFDSHTYLCHGYSAVAALLEEGGMEEVIWHYPLNLNVLQNALNIIVHSHYSRKLAEQFYGDSITDNWSVIPHLKVAPEPSDREQARARLMVKKEDFLVCSFGFTGPIKLNHRLLTAWQRSKLFDDARCVLVFVGENDPGDYGDALLAQIKGFGMEASVRITGWADKTLYQDYLTAADIGVQLRTRSRGETSGAVLDCMNYGLATIANENGTMVDIADDAVFKLPDDFDDSELVVALQRLWQDAKLREQLSARALEVIASQYQPLFCANAYFSTIESTYLKQALLPSLSELLSLKVDVDSHIATTEQEKLIEAIGLSYAPRSYPKCLFIDISAIVSEDLHTGIQRVVRAQLEVLLRRPPKGVRVEPVYLSCQDGAWHFYCAHQWSQQFLGLSSDTEDQVVEFHRGDVLFCADLNTGLAVQADIAGLYQSLMSSGCQVFFQVFDLLPISNPEWFPNVAEEGHIAWAQVVSRCSGAICISHAVAEEFKSWCKRENLALIHTEYFHLGADIDNSSPSLGLPDNADDVLSKLASSTSFLMVGTIEPRKGHLQTLNAFEALWLQGEPVNLVIVGNPGWLVEEVIEALNNHPERNRHLFWLKSVSDEFLEKLYSASSCLIAASEGEGFGLPLIEAAQHNLPIIARDLPVFREVAGDFAHYFDGLEADLLKTSIGTWLKLNAEGKTISSQNMPWLTWQQSTERLVTLLGFELLE